MTANCIICSDLFDETSPISAAKCGHVYHSSCLTSWLDQSKSCPHCRAHITPKDFHKLYFDFSPKHDLTSDMENEIVNLKSQLSEKTAEILACKKDKQDLEVYVRDAENRCSELQQAVAKVLKLEHHLEHLKFELQKSIDSKNKLIELTSRLKKENCSFASKIKFFEDVMAMSNKSPSTPAKSSYQTTEAHVSPITVNFKQTKFNTWIKSTCAVSRSNPVEQAPMKNSVVASMQCNTSDTDSFMRIGYNGHLDALRSNFITYRIKKSNS